MRSRRASCAHRPPESERHERRRRHLLPINTMTRQRFYVYAIYVAGVVRYIGKGSNGRLSFHVIEARRINSRRALGANTDCTATNFYRKLAEAMRHGATITEEIMVDGLTDREAYRIEKQKIEELHKHNRGQLWNTIDERFIGITWKEYKQKRQFSPAKGLTSSPSVSPPYKISKFVGREMSPTGIVRRNAATYVTRKRGLL